MMMFAFLGASISGLLVYFISSRSMRKVDPVKLAISRNSIRNIINFISNGYINVL